MAVALVPGAGLEVGGEPARTVIRLLRRQQRQSGDVGAHLGVEVALGPAPVRRHEAVLAVVGHGHDLDSIGPERSGDRFDRGDPRAVVLHRHRPVVVEPVGALQHVVERQDHLTARDALQFGEAGVLVSPVMDGEHREARRRTRRRGTAGVRRHRERVSGPRAAPA